MELEERTCIGEKCDSVFKVNKEHPQSWCSQECKQDHLFRGGCTYTSYNKLAYKYRYTKELKQKIFIRKRFSGERGAEK